MVCCIGSAWNTERSNPSEFISSALVHCLCENVQISRSLLIGTVKCAVSDDFCLFAQ